VNTLDERPFESPLETLASYQDLIWFAELAGLIAPDRAARLRRLEARAGAPIVKRARTLREQLHDILAAAHAGQPPRPGDLAGLSSAIRAAHAAQTLVAVRSPGLAHHGWSRPAAPDIPLHACALAIERLLVDEDRARIRKCGARDCDVYYLDTSKAQIRQWCSMKGCGNREKQRRWRGDRV
jgi:predicted RNA-binding Zn ribbon-like protein